MQKVFEQRLNELKNTSVVEKVFSVRHLPGYIFVTASPLKISEAYRGASLYDSWLPLPIPMQPNEWHGSLEALPWLNHYIPPGSWVIIDDHPDTAEIGKLGYVLGSCQETQRSIVAVVPSLPRLDMTHDQDQSKKTPHERGKAARQTAFQREVALAKSRFLASEEEARIATATIRIERQRSEIKRSACTPEERQKKLADLKIVEEMETSWSIPESRKPRSRKAGAPRLWTLGDYHTTQKVFGVRHSPETSFSKAFANKFRLPKISRCPDTALKVEVVEMDTKTFDWAFAPTNEYIVYEYLGGFYLYGLRILPIFSPNTLQPLPVPPLGDELQSFVDSHVHRASVHRLFSVLHWKHGDRIKFQNETYLLEGLKIDEGSVTGRKINLRFSEDPVHEQSQVDVPMSVHDVDRIFCVGDGVEVIAGNYKGQTGTVIGEEGGCLTIWTTFSEESIPVSCSDSESKLKLTLLLHKISISVSRLLVVSCLVTSNAKKLKVGAEVRVISGPLSGSRGKVIRIQGGLLWFVRFGVEVCCVFFCCIEVEPS